ncbi:DNA-3-methyladenine glycosylase II [Roseiarcus fermentans]|uniref:DNA-3-methyladenine glycosylase II n=2 Tax=Roseiarcus fermentans TaxID=1473586 RepID=A0A366EZZ4_9HYPH|nr:DNA-3-methyladenine glycosylase II [Roseiarcus fermentans]
MHKPGRRASRGKPPPGARLYRPGPPIADEASLGAAVEALRAQDPELMARLLAVAGPPPLRRRAPGFAGLAAIVVSQQVSVASARAILGRLEARVAPLDAERLAAVGDEDLRTCGLSAAKIRALRAVARAIADGALDLDRLAELDAEGAHRALVAITGIGPWTADIFLMFCLGHPDAFAAGDLALQEAARLAFDLEARPDAARLERLAERWRPWRAVAARVLWAYYRAVKARSGMALADGSS